MGWLTGKPKHSSGETKGQTRTSRHGGGGGNGQPAPIRRRIPARLCSCNSGISANVCNCQRVRSGKTRVPTMGKGTTRKWGQR